MKKILKWCISLLIIILICGTSYIYFNNKNQMVTISLLMKNLMKKIQGVVLQNQMKTSLQEYQVSKY